MSIFHLLHWSYWFSQPLIARDAVGVTLWIIMALFAIGVVTFYVLYRYEIDPVRKTFWTKAVRLNAVAGLVFSLWFYFRQERVAILAWRFWLLLGTLYLVYRGYGLYRYYTKRIPEIRAQTTQRLVRQKYLPKKKK